MATLPDRFGHFIRASGDADAATGPRLPPELEAMTCSPNREVG